MAAVDAGERSGTSCGGVREEDVWILVFEFSKLRLTHIIVRPYDYTTNKMICHI